MKATFAVNEDKVNFIRAIAYWKRELIKDTMEDAIDYYIEKHKDILDKAMDGYRKHKLYMGK